MEPVTPPTLDEVRARLRPAIGDLPATLSAWAAGTGPLDDVPLLGPGDVAPKAFDSLSGTVRVAAVADDLVTVAGLLELSTGGVLATTMVLSPTDLSAHTAPAGSGVDFDAASRSVLSEAGARADAVMVEVVALLSGWPDEAEDGAPPTVGVGVVRPLAFADPSSLPHPDDDTRWPDATLAAARDAAAAGEELLCDLGGPPLAPMSAELSRIWGPLFLVARSATIGLAARAAQA